MPRAIRQSTCQAHGGRGRFIAGLAARRVSRRRRPGKRRARRARHVGRAVIARSPCDEAIQGRRRVRRQGAADGSDAAPGLLRRFAPRNDENRIGPKLIAHAKSAWRFHAFVGLIATSATPSLRGALATSNPGAATRAAPGAADSSAAAPGLLRHFAPRNDENRIGRKPIANAKSA